MDFNQNWEEFCLNNLHLELPSWINTAILNSNNDNGCSKPLIICQSKKVAEKAYILCKDLGYSVYQPVVHKMTSEVNFYKVELLSNFIAEKDLSESKFASELAVMSKLIDMGKTLPHDVVRQPTPEAFVDKKFLNSPMLEFKNLMDLEFDDFLVDDSKEVPFYPEFFSIESFILERFNPNSAVIDKLLIQHLIYNVISAVAIDGFFDSSFEFETKNTALLVASILNVLNKDSAVTKITKLEDGIQKTTFVVHKLSSVVTLKTVQHAMDNLLSLGICSEKQLNTVIEEALKQEVVFKKERSVSQDLLLHSLKILDQRIGLKEIKEIEKVVEVGSNHTSTESDDENLKIQKFAKVGLAVTVFATLLLVLYSFT